MSTDTINLAYYYFSMDTEFEGKSIHSYAEILLPTNIVSAEYSFYLKILSWKFQVGTNRYLSQTSKHLT